MTKNVIRMSFLALVLAAQGPAQAVDFGDRTPEASELVDALKPPRLKRGPVGVSGASAATKGRVSMQIGFEFGSNKVMSTDLPKLQRLAEALGSEQLRSVSYKVIGHTDASGPLAINMRLSRQRAESVLTYLTRQGIDESRLIAEGRGPTELLNPDKPDGAENRRVEIRMAQ